MSDPALPKTYSKAHIDKLTEAVTALRISPACKIFEQCLRDLLEQRKDELVHNTSAMVPTLQGRAQQLNDILAILNRKPN